MKVQFIKTHKDAKLPTRNHDNDFGTSDTGYDLYAVEDVVIPPSKNKTDQIIITNGSEIRIGSAIVPVGLEVAYIEEGYWFKIEGRSGLGFKHGIQPHGGIIDNQYRGDLGVKLYNFTENEYHVKAGDKIAQMVIYKLIDAKMSFADEKNESTRGENGFGSSGR